MDSVTSVSATTLDPGAATKKIYKNESTTTKPNFKDLDWIASQGNFQSRPSNTFLMIYGDVLAATYAKPASAVVSPALMGTSGVVPLSIISIIPDIMKQYADCIKSAKQEILIATNAWEPGRCVDIVVDAIKELNSRCVKEKRKVTIKLLMDAASLRNAIQSRYPRPSKSWPDISIPVAEDIPAIDLEVVNYHVAPLGTFHSKFAVFDRQVALVNSNNINLRSNVEMMTRFEGDVVNSLYDTFIISWHTKLPVPLPNMDRPSPASREFIFAHDENESQSRGTFRHSTNPESQDILSSLQTQLKTNQTSYSNEDHPEESISVNKRLNVQESIEQTATSDEADSFHPYIFHTRHTPVPMALVNRQPHNLPGHGDVVNPQNNAWLAALKYAQKSVFIQSPVCNATPIVAAIADACRRGIVVTVYVGLGFNDFAEGIVPFQNGTNEEVLARLQKDLRSDGCLENLHWHWYTAKDQNMPVRFEKQARNCHVKFFQVDDEVAIMGSGNQDTQSWFHSQEVNVMIDSQLLCKDWKTAFQQIQNTEQYGKVDHSAADGFLTGGRELPKKKGFGGLKRSQGGFL